MADLTMAPSLSEATRNHLLDWALIAELGGHDLMVSDGETGRFVACSASAAGHLGYSPEALLELSPEALQADPDHDAVWVSARRQELLASGGGSFETRHRRQDDSIVEVDVVHRVQDLDGRPLIVSLVRDRSTQLQRETQLHEQLQLLADGEALSGLGSWDLRFADGRMRWSTQMQRLCRTGEGCGTATFWAYGALVHPDDRQSWRQEFQRALNRGDLFRHRHRLAFLDGSEMLVQAEATFTYDNSGQAIRAVGTLRDVSQERLFLQEQTIERSSDPLTGLPNKLASLEELSRRLNGRPYNASLAVLSLDVDGFQEINDNFGSDVGDRVLQVMARRLRDLIGERGWLARLSSDQFLVLLEEHINSLGDAMSLGRQLQQRWSQQGEVLAELPIFPTFSIGLATYPEHG